MSYSSTVQVPNKLAVKGRINGPVKIYQAMHTAFARPPAGKPAPADNRLVTLPQLMQLQKPGSQAIICGHMGLIRDVVQYLQPSAEILVAGYPGGNIYPLLPRTHKGIALTYRKFSNPASVFKYAGDKTSIVWLEKYEGQPVKISALTAVVQAAAAYNYNAGWVALLEEQLHTPLFRWELALHQHN